MARTLHRVSKETEKLIFVFKWDDSSQMLENVLPVIKKEKDDFILKKGGRRVHNARTLIESKKIS